MYRSFKDRRERKELMDHYKVFRRGVITLPYLERNLENDLERLDRYIEVHKESPLQAGFIEVAILNLETAKDLVESTLEAIESLAEYVATSGRVMDRVSHAKYVSENIRDEEAEHLILNTLRVHGGITGLLGISHNIFAAKYLAYSKAVRLAKMRTEEHFEQAQSILRDHYHGELMTLEDYWKNLLEEEANAAGGEPYFSQVTYDLCTRYPDIAERLGIACPKEMWPIILIAVACAILCEGD